MGIFPTKPVSLSSKSKPQPYFDCILYSKIISVADDSIMLVFDLHLNRLKTITLNDEMYSIASNSVDQIALGGEMKQVDLF
jgi:hypothetical protein